MQLLSAGNWEGTRMDADQAIRNHIGLVRTLGLEDDPRFDIEWYEAVNLVVTTNGFAIARDGDYRIGHNGQKLGSGVYPVASFFNHSCAPNTTWSVGLCDTPGYAFNAITLKATMNIEPGEQLFASYVSNDAPRHIRQLQLRRYGFECKCILCRFEEIHPDPESVYRAFGFRK